MLQYILVVCRNRAVSDSIVGAVSHPLYKVYQTVPPARLPESLRGMNLVIVRIDPSHPDDMSVWKGILQRAPRRVLLVSADQAQAVRLMDATGIPVGFLAEPHLPEILIARVRELLGAPTGPLTPLVVDDAHPAMQEAIVPAATGPLRIRDLAAPTGPLRPRDPTGQLRARDATGPLHERVIPAPPVAARPLTDRQREVLGLIRQGKTDRQIADTLGVSEHTVSAHVQALLQRLGAHSRVEAVALYSVEVE